MKAKLKDGQIITLEKNCGCLDDIHIGPHWLHMDSYTKSKNLELLRKAQRLVDVDNFIAQMQGAALLNRFAELEVMRLQELTFNMESRGIVQLIRD